MEDVGLLVFICFVDFLRLTVAVDEAKMLRVSYLVMLYVADVAVHVYSHETRFQGASDGHELKCLR